MEEAGQFALFVEFADFVVKQEENTIRSTVKTRGLLECHHFGQWDFWWGCPGTGSRPRHPNDKNDYQNCS